MKTTTGMPNTNGVAFPAISAKADTLPGQHDGTPLLAWWLDELLGFLQASLWGAHIIPSGTADAAGATLGDIESCQVLQAIQWMFSPPGQIVALAATSVPAYARLLECNGQVVDVADYPRLVDVSYVGDVLNATATAFYRASDAGGTVHSTTGAYFVLPDLRGYFLRGYDPLGTVDKDGASRYQGAIQHNAITDHRHEGLFDDGANAVGLDQDSMGTGSTVYNARKSGSDTIFTGHVEDDPDVPTAVESRPENAVVLWCVTY